jgi:hypothetical protein
MPTISASTCIHAVPVRLAPVSGKVVRPPRFEPGLPAWEASVLTMLDYSRTQKTFTQPGNKSLLGILKHVVRLHCGARKAVCWKTSKSGWAFARFFFLPVSIEASVEAAHCVAKHVSRRHLLVKRSSGV